MNSDSRLDGNTLAGPLGALFTSDLTIADAVCAGCGHSTPVAALPIFGAPMGLVARCPGCDQVMLSYTELPTGRTLQMHGTAALLVPTT